MKHRRHYRQPFKNAGGDSSAAAATPVAEQVTEPPVAEPTPEVEESTQMSFTDDISTDEAVLAGETMSTDEEVAAQEAVIETTEEPVVEAVEEPVYVAPIVMADSIIAEGDTIEGDLATVGHLTVYGTHRGNILAGGDVTVIGSVYGDITARNLALVGGTATAAQITVSNDVTVAQGSTVTADISCANIAVSAAITGNISASAACVIHETAVVEGDIAVGSISIREGAKINSRISIVR